MPRSETTFKNQDFVETNPKTETEHQLSADSNKVLCHKVLCHKDISKHIHDVTKPIITSDDVVFNHKQFLDESKYVSSQGNDNSVELSDKKEILIERSKKDISIERSKVLSDKNDIPIEREIFVDDKTDISNGSEEPLTDISIKGASIDQSDIWIEQKEIIGPTFHRNDSFNKAVNGEEEEGDEDKKSVIH